MNYSCYLVCKGHLAVVKNFLSKFFKEKKGKYNHPGWVSFKVPNSKMNVHLMHGKDQPLTKNITFEASCKSKEQLEKLAKRYNSKIESFPASTDNSSYMFYYIEIPGPKNICKIEISYATKPKKKV